MYEGAEKEINRILKLVESCPETLRSKAFEILLQGFVASLGRSVPSAPPASPPAPPSPPVPPADLDWASSIPAEVSPRLKAMAKRRSIPPENIAALFDFSADPFSFAPMHVPGPNLKQRERRVALLVAARAFLATGRWVADWAEIKAMCTHQNCYDPANFAATLKKAKGDIFKGVTVGQSVELSAAGTDQAEKLIAEISSADDAAKQ